MLDTVVIYGEYVCCSVVFGTLVSMFVFSVMWSELLMTDVSCSLWSSMYQCHNVERAFKSPVRTECGMFVMWCGVCLRFLFCSAWMCSLEEVYRCLLL